MNYHFIKKRLDFSLSSTLFISAASGIGNDFKSSSLLKKDGESSVSSLGFFVSTFKETECKPFKTTAVDFFTKKN